MRNRFLSNTIRFETFLFFAGLGVTAFVSGCARAADDWRAAGWKPAQQPDLAEQLKSAKTLEVEDVLTAPGTVRWEGPRWVRNPDGKSWDAIFQYYQQYTGPTEFIIVDFGSGEVKKQRIERIPRQKLAHNFHLTPTLEIDGKLYLNATNYDRINVWVYDPATNELSHKGPIAAPIGYEMRPWTLASDGFIYGSGQYEKSKKVGLYRLDPKTMEVKDYGAVGPAHPNGAWASGVAVDLPWIYVTSGKVPWYVVAYNTQTGEERVLLESQRLDGLTKVGSIEGGATGYMIKPKQNPFADEFFQKERERIDFWIKDAKLYPRRSHQDWNAPWQKEPLDSPRQEQDKARREYSASRPELFTEALKPDKDGFATLWYRAPEDKAKAPKETPPNATPQELGWKSLRFEATTYAEPIRRMAELPDGRIFASVGQYEMAIFDPKNQKVENLGSISLSTYTMLYKDGSVYLSGYPLAATWEFDLNKPYTLAAPNPVAQTVIEDAKENNPRLLVRLDKWTRVHKMQDGALGADGKIYFGGEVVRNGTGGGLGWWDPAKEEGGGIFKPFTAHQIHWMTSAQNGRYIVASTAARPDDLDPQRVVDGGAIFIFDVEKSAIIHEITPFPKLGKSGPIAEALPGLLLGHAGAVGGEGGVLYGVDVASGRVLFRHSVPTGPTTASAQVRRAREDYRRGPDGYIWTYFDDVLVRIEPKTLKIEVVGKLENPGRLAFVNGQVYVGSEATLRRIKSLTTPSPGA